MKEFLANIRPPKYLRYLFFIGYCWYRSFKSERDEAHGSVIIFLGTIHIIFFMSILFITIPQIIFELGKYELVIPVFLFISAMSYYLFWYQNKWKFFLQEFSHLKRKQQRIGLIYLFIYLFSSLAFFVFSIYIIIQKSPHYN